MRGLAVLAALTVLLPGGSQTVHAAALVLGAIYVGYWLVVPRAWSILLAALTVPAALAATNAPGPRQVIDLLWVYPALVLGFAVAGAWGLAMLCLLVVLAVASTLVLSGESSVHEAWLVALPVLLAGLAASTARRLLSANEDLARARQQLAVAAVQEERTRFARDLHDLLGHSLTVLVAKLRLARRLPADEATTELSDAEHLALTALDEVRQAVEGYRGPTLDSQIAGARAALQAAGIGFDVTGSAGPAAAEAEHVLALSVREAVTNVIRHSGASRCWLSLGRDHGTAWVEIRDNGRGPGESHGSGLAGIRERTDRLGGSAAWGPAAGGGFQVRVAVPAEQRTGEPAEP